MFGRKFVLILCLTFIGGHSILQGDELDEDPTSVLINPDQSPLFVSLGADCLTASMMRHFGKMQAAFPFDWMLTLDIEQ